MITLALIVMILGLIIYLAIDPALRGGRVLEVGRIMFAFGLLATLLAYAGKALL